MFGQSIANPARALGKNDAAFDLQLEMNLIFFLKCDVESAGVENLAQFDLYRAQHFVLVEMRTDGLPDLGEQLVFLGSPLRFVHHDIVFEGQRDL